MQSNVTKGTPKEKFENMFKWSYERKTRKMCARKTKKRIIHKMGVLNEKMCEKID